MDDNATCHRTLAVQDYLDSEGIQRLVWPARSPDLNPIENVWDALGRQVAGRNYPPTNKNTLIRALTEEWDKLPQQLLDNVVSKYGGPRNLSWKGVSSTPVVSRNSEHHAGDSKIRLSSTPILKENTLGVVKVSHLFSPSTNFTRGLAARRLFEVLPCRKGTIHLQTSNAFSGIRAQAQDTATSVTNHYIR
ncbi:transposable element Tc3 transposase [Trichonephila clavipes]|nr:transposable element Tc3 transposase [Trichonephila clavipes]